MKRIDKAFKCSECEYCCKFRPEGFKQSSYFCDHPNKEYIHNHFMKKKKNSIIERFLGYGEGPTDKISRPYSPIWCPKKEEFRNNQNNYQKEKRSKNEL